MSKPLHGTCKLMVQSTPSPSSHHVPPRSQHDTILNGSPHHAPKSHHHHHQQSSIVIVIISSNHSSFLFLCLLHLAPTVMAISSHAALNKVAAGGISELDDYITKVLEACRTVGATDVIQPVGLPFVVSDKIFVGTNQNILCCPAQLLLCDGLGQTKLCAPVWTNRTLWAKVNRKVKVRTKKLSVIGLDDFTALPHDKAPSGHAFLIRSYLVLKKDVDEEAHLARWTTEN
jgi:hypothetical protein